MPQRGLAWPVDAALEPSASELYLVDGRAKGPGNLCRGQGYRQVAQHVQRDCGRQDLGRGALAVAGESCELEAASGQGADGIALGGGDGQVPHARAKYGQQGAFAVSSLGRDPRLAGCGGHGHGPCHVWPIVPEPRQHLAMFLRTLARGERTKDLFGLGHPTRLGKGVRVGGDDIWMLTALRVCLGKKGQGKQRLPQGSVEDVPQIVRVPGVVGADGQGAQVCVPRITKVTQERLREGQSCPGAVFAGVDLEHPARVERRAPWRLLEQELGQVTVGEGVFFGAKGCMLRKAPKQRQNARRRRRGREGFLDHLSQARGVCLDPHPNNDVAVTARICKAPVRQKRRAEHSDALAHCDDLLLLQLAQDA